MREIGDRVDPGSAVSALLDSLLRKSFTDWDSGKLEMGFLTLEEGFELFLEA